MTICARGGHPAEGVEPCHTLRVPFGGRPGGSGPGARCYHGRVPLLLLRGPTDHRRWQLNAYELMVIVDPEAEEEMLGQVADRITGIVSGKGGEVQKVDRWGKRKLAHEINRKGEGHYLLVTFRSDPSVLPDLDRALSLADEVLRFKVLRMQAA
ncbi:MAG TPA: 30S ribosomal protein S6 [Actinomycetota bacterium]|nr:30S ribosomal protein S6 [Actinomycetota bacterium]